jgi:hypothetical protein
MEPLALRRAFRARPGTDGCIRFAGFLAELNSSEPAWRRLAALLERDVIPVVSRCHPDVECDEISSACFGGAFEGWIREWLDSVHAASAVRSLLTAERHEDAMAELAKHPRFRGERAGKAEALWNLRRWYDALRLVEGTRSARSHFIARTRARISESQRKQRRQSHLMTRHCSDALGISASGVRQAMAGQAARTICGAELASSSDERHTLRISALPPAHLPSQDLASRLRRMLGAIDQLGPEHARVFKLLLEGLSQRSIAKVEGRHPAAISRRVRILQELCRVQLLE